MRYTRSFLVATVLVAAFLGYSGCHKAQPLDPLASRVGGVNTTTVVVGSLLYQVDFVGVTYSGSTSTWNYNVTGLDPSKDISHVIFGLGCAEPADVIGVTGGAAAFTEGNTGCTPSGNFVKITPSINSASGTFSFTLNHAYLYAEDGISAWVKAGSVNSNPTGGCGSGALDGPGCELLTMRGNVQKIECVLNFSAQGAYGGVTVTATQGTDVRTTTTDAAGNYEFVDLGGTWIVSVPGADPQTVTLPPQHAGADFVVDLRPNGTCPGDESECESDVDENGECDEDEGCAFSQGYFFGGNFFNQKNATVIRSWPRSASSVVIGGYSYTQVEAFRIWKTTGSKALPFSQACAVKLSGTVTSNQALTAVATIDAYYASLGYKLTPQNLPTPPANVHAAAGLLGSWITIHHCP